LRINTVLEEDGETQNRYGLKVLARTMAITSFIFIVLALLAQKGVWITLAIGLLIGLAAFLIYRSLGKEATK